MAFRTALLAIAVVSSCAPSRPRCFECGLTEEWARADRERAEHDRRAREDEARAIQGAVANGDDEQLFHAIGFGDRRAVDTVAAALERGSHVQSAELLARLEEFLIHYPAGDPALEAARELAFELIAASRGEAARPVLEACASTALAAACRRALARIIEGGR